MRARDGSNECRTSNFVELKEPRKWSVVVVKEIEFKLNWLISIYSLISACSAQLMLNLLPPWKDRRKLGFQWIQTFVLIKSLRSSKLVVGYFLADKLKTKSESTVFSPTGTVVRRGWKLCTELYYWFRKLGLYFTKSEYSSGGSI